MTTQYPPQKYVQPLARYRCEDGHIFQVIRTRALRGYNPVLECPEPALHPLYVGHDCHKPAVRVGEGGFWPIRVRDREQVRQANKERGLKQYRVYRRHSGALKITGGL